MVPDWGDGEAPELGTQRNLYYDKVMAEDTKNMEPVQASLRSPTSTASLPATTSGASTTMRPASIG